MMNYEIFKKVVAEKFMDYMPEEMQYMKVRVDKTRKVNMTLDSLTVVNPNKKRNMCPTTYINDMYKEYKQTNNLDEVLNKTAFNMVKFMNQPDIIIPEFNYENVKNNIVFQLINTEQNKDMLINVPHREFLDLSIIYRWVVSNDNDGVNSVIVTNELAIQYGMTENQLFITAIENTRRILPPVVKDMNSIIREMFIKDGMPEEMADMMIGEIPSENMMYVITNEKGINGAASMMYEDKLHELSEKLESDLYILPSSVHEVIAVSSEMGDPNELADMVFEINMGQVELNERLSNQVYHYDKDLRKLTLATNTPNKHLD